MQAEETIGRAIIEAALSITFIFCLLFVYIGITFCSSPDSAIQKAFTRPSRTLSCFRKHIAKISCIHLLWIIHQLTHILVYVGFTSSNSWTSHQALESKHTSFASVCSENEFLSVFLFTRIFSSLNSSIRPIIHINRIRLCKTTIIHTHGTKGAECATEQTHGVSFLRAHVRSNECLPKQSPRTNLYGFHYSSNRTLLIPCWSE